MYSYIAGCNGTSNVLAGMMYGIPVFGTMPHSYVMFFDKEIDSFRAFARTFPRNSTLLIDTYDNLKGLDNALIVAKELEKEGNRLNAVRLDSGDLLFLSKKVREILEKNGLGYVKIFASGDLDEYKIENLVKKGTKIDAFGVGTRMSASSDRPYLDIVYKLSEKFENGVFVPEMKLSNGKLTLPGKKPIFRQRNKEGKYAKDVIALADEGIEGETLLLKVMEDGEIVYSLPTLEEIRNKTLKNLSELPEKYQKLTKHPPYNVELSPRLEEVKRKLSTELKDKKILNDRILPNGNILY